MMRRSRWFLLTETVAMAVLAFCAPGCSRSNGGPERANISGHITLNGKPLHEGSITFLPIQGTRGPATGATITNGQYDIPRDRGPVVGRNRVQIVSMKKTGKQIPFPGRSDVTYDETIPLLPACYNARSTLTAEIRSGSNVQNFELTASKSR